MTESTLRIGVLAPEVLGTYGDSGNAAILAERVRRRGLKAEVIVIPLLEPIPVELDIYTLGGGEDTAQALAAEHLRKHDGLARAVAQGKPVLAICAALQILGNSYTDAYEQTVAGAGLLDVDTVPMGHRAIGEIITDPLLEGLTEPLTGFENHGGRTILGPDAAPLGQVVLGCGNGAADTDGAVQGSIIATYMHGPVLARNPQLADLILSRGVGRDLEPLEMPTVARLREERLAHR